MSYVKVIVTGNAYAYKMSYRRGLHLVSPEIAKRLIDYGVAKKVDEPETATIPEPKTERAVKESKPKRKTKKK